MTKPVLWVVLLAILLFSYPARASADDLSFGLDAEGFALAFETEFVTGPFLVTFSPWFTLDADGLGLGLGEAYLAWTWAGFDFTLGRRIIALGPGRHGHPILGPHGTGLTAEGYDQASYSFASDDFLWGDLDYTRFYACVPEDRYRMLMGHRADYTLGRLTLGLTETALVKEEASWLVYLPLPFIPMYLLQHIAKNTWGTTVDKSVNINAQIDLSWQPFAGLRLYGVYFADDRPGFSLGDGGLTPADPDRVPWRIGYQAGLAWERVFGLSGLVMYAEYTRLNQFTYTSPHAGLNYTYHGLMLGDPLGPDADRLNLELAWARPKGTSWSLALLRERRGEGGIGDQWVYTPGQTEVFLTGVVETTYSLALTLARDIGPAGLSLTVAWSETANAGHVEGATESGLELSASGSIAF